MNNNDDNDVGGDDDDDEDDDDDSNLALASRLSGRLLDTQTLKNCPSGL